MNLSDTQQLVLLEAKRVVELLESGQLVLPDRWGYAPDKGELVRKMHEFRRDSVRLEKLLRS